MELLRGVADLKEGRPAAVAEFFGFSDWRSVVAFAKSGEGAHLLTFVNLVESRGEKQLMWALNRTVTEDAANIVVSTAHKAKGREWARVRLMDDFLRSNPRDPDRGGLTSKSKVDPSEIRLLYVAMTRAREELEIPPPIATRFGIRCEAQVLKPRSGAAATVDSSQAHPAPWQPPADWQPREMATSEPAPPQQPPTRKGFLDWLLK